MARARKPKRSSGYRKLAADYEACGGNVLSTLFPDDAELHAAFLAWAEKAWPHWFAEVAKNFKRHKPALRAWTLEQLISDEEEETSVCAFFDQLPATTRAPILAAIARLAKGEEPAPTKPAAKKKKAAPPRQVAFGKTKFGSDVTELELEGHRLTALPDEIGDFAALETLDLSGNPVTALPASLARCLALRTLLVGDTRLAALPALPQIEVLSAYQVSESFLASLDAAPNLTNLCISECGLTALPASLRALKRLAYLDFRDNKIKKLPTWIEELSVTNFAWNEDLPAAEVARLEAMERKNRTRRRAT